MAINLAIDRPLPETAQRDIRSFINHADALVQVLSSSRTESPTVSPASAFRTIAATLSIGFSEVSRIFAALDNLVVLREELGGTDRVLSLLEKRLNPDAIKELEDRREKVREVIELYSSSHPIAISLKAEKLSYLYENILQDAEIITDVRPIFNTDGTKILEMVITHSLVLSTYSPGIGSRRVHFAMDAVDVLKLRRLCDRATVKADSARREMGGMPWITKVLNDESDDV
jgi:hypothetical protein